MAEGLRDPEELERVLNSYLLGALTIHDIMKAVPHPYDAPASAASKWAHDFIGFSFQLQRTMAAMEAENAQLRTDLALAQLIKSVSE